MYNITIEGCTRPLNIPIPLGYIGLKFYMLEFCNQLNKQNSERIFAASWDLRLYIAQFKLTQSDCDSLEHFHETSIKNPEDASFQIMIHYTNLLMDLIIKQTPGRYEYCLSQLDSYYNTQPLLPILLDMLTLSKQPKPVITNKLNQAYRAGNRSESRALAKLLKCNNMLTLHPEPKSTPQMPMQSLAQALAEHDLIKKHQQLKNAAVKGNLVALYYYALLPENTHHKPDLLMFITHRVRDDYQHSGISLRECIIEQFRINE